MLAPWPVKKLQIIPNGTRADAILSADIGTQSTKVMLSYRDWGTNGITAMLSASNRAAKVTKTDGISKPKDVSST